MAVSYRTVVLLAFLALASNPYPTSSQKCSPSNFTANGTYSLNRKRALFALSTHLIANGGFSNATAGEAPDRVYAVAFCRPEADKESCLSCVNDTVRDIMTACPYQKDAYWWTGDVPCLVRYSNSSILGQITLDPPDVVYNTGDLNANLVLFNQTWSRLMESLIGRASTVGSSRNYAVEKANLDSFMIIYAMVLCTPDLSGGDCRKCLWEAAASYRHCCFGKQGGFSKRPSCMMRWDLYPFHNISDDSVRTLPPLPPSYSPSPNPENRKGTTKNGGGNHSTRTVIIAVSLPYLVLTVAVLIYCLFRRRKLAEKPAIQEEDETQVQEPGRLKFDLRTIQTATDDFDEKNKLGRGGFGSVYKGKLPNGNDIAVKRLDSNSQQGEREFRNEVLLMAKLEHRNLARLLGYCLEKGERILIYEFVSNSSLDHHLFAKTNGHRLSWWVRYQIICGIARGLLYLHIDSRLRIIHRDLKASNVLLDSRMNPKISDFGLAKLCDQTEGYTRRLVGTRGYMAPEYVKDGNFSAKSDVYSFGIIVLEILSGEQNTEFCRGEELESLTSYAWRLWKEGRSLDFFDPTIRDSSSSELNKCLHIGLLAVQEKAAKRPNMNSVVIMLNSNTISMDVPRAPGFRVRRDGDTDSTDSTSQMRSAVKSVAQVSITDLVPR